MAGAGISPNGENAKKYLTIAAEQGDALAQNNLAGLYYEGKLIKQDYVQAAKWYQKAAEAGIKPAQSTLALMYKYGRGVPADTTKACMWMILCNPSYELQKEILQGMTGPQIYAGKQMATQWSQSHPNL